MKILLLSKESCTDTQFTRIYKNLATQLCNISVFDRSTLYYAGKTVSAKDKLAWINQIKPVLNQYDVLLVSDGDYFKFLTKQTKTDTTLGNWFKSPYLEPKVMYIPSHKACMFNWERTFPKVQTVIQQLQAIQNHTYHTNGDGIIHSEAYPKTVSEISDWLNRLHKYPALTLDIEACSLKFYEAGIYTITLCWDKHNGIAFPVDAIPNQQEQVRDLLRQFFKEYQGKLIVHKGNYDIMVLNYVLFQHEDITNIKGQIEGLNIFFGSDCQKVDDTLIITYLATNNCQGNVLGLKELAAEFAGDWAVDVKDVTKVPLDDLLKYNLIDGLSTWYVYDKYYPKMLSDEQESLYKDFMLPTLRTNIRCQLNGLPIDLDEVNKFAYELNQEQQELLTKLKEVPEVKQTEWILAERLTDKRNAKLKTKQTTVEENLKPMNFGSDIQLCVLLYEVMALPTIDYTKGKQPATGKKVLQKLMNHTEEERYKEILQWLCDLSDVTKILTAFIPAFKESVVDREGNAHLCGYLNLAGAVSGRLSSSNP